jgi:hypothetical protein
MQRGQTEAGAYGHDSKPLWGCAVMADVAVWLGAILAKPYRRQRRVGPESYPLSL